MRIGARRVFVAASGLLALIFVCVTGISAQQTFAHGQNVAPAFEGWERNPDGSFSMVFGFFNRNCEEALHIPIGPDNSIEPGGPDRGQPTRFFPRRGKFIFKVRVPSDFGKNELVWTLTAHGKTERAYATLQPEYVLDSWCGDLWLHRYPVQLPALGSVWLEAYLLGDNKARLRIKRSLGALGD